MQTALSEAGMHRVKTVFFLVGAEQAWLLLSPAERQQFVTAVLGPILAKHAQVRLRFFDAEAWHARVSDVLMWEFADEHAYRSLVEHLRETPFWGRYFSVHEIIPCVEDAYAEHYGISPVSQAVRGASAAGRDAEQ
jgi:hypothetical protein